MRSKNLFPLPDLLLRDVGILILFMGMLFGFMLGTRPLSAPDEGRYAEIPREMVVTGDYITPRLNGVKYFEKPPLMYWLHSLSIRFFGIQEAALRFWPAFFGVLGCLIVYLGGRSLYGRGTGWAGALILGTSVLYYAHAHLLILDLALGVLMAAALFGYLLATRSPPGGKQRFLLGVFFSCTGLAVLCKGLIGALLPGGIILIWCLIYQNWKALRQAFTPWGILLFLLIAVPWHISVSLRNPEFPAFYFIKEHLLRFTTPIHRREQPWWFFIPILILGLFPWVIFLGHTLWVQMQKIRQNFLTEEPTLFLLLWSGLIFTFFSFSHSKLIPYIIPIFPPLALLIGRYLTLFWKEKQIRQGLWVFEGIASIFLITLPFILAEQNLLMEPLLKPYFLMIYAILLGGIGLVLWILLSNRLHQTLPILTGFSILFLVTLHAAWPFAEQRSIKPLAVFLNKHLKPQDYVVTFGRYYQDLPPYLGRIVHVVSWKGELEFGMSIEDTRRWMIDEKRFLELWNGDEIVYMISRKGTLEELKAKQIKKIYVLASTPQDVLVTNRKPN